MYAITSELENSSLQTAKSSSRLPLRGSVTFKICLSLRQKKKKQKPKGIKPSRQSFTEILHNSVCTLLRTYNMGCPMKMPVRIASGK